MQSLFSAPVVNIHRIMLLQAHTQTYKGASLYPSYNMLICGSKPDDWIISDWAGEEADIGILSVWWAAQHCLCSCLTHPWWIIHMRRDCWEKEMSKGYRWQRHDHRVYFLYLFLTVFLFQSLPHFHFLWTWMFLKKVCELWVDGGNESFISCLNREISAAERRVIITIWAPAQETHYPEPRLHSKLLESK